MTQSHVCGDGTGALEIDNEMQVNDVTWMKLILYVCDEGHNEKCNDCCGLISLVCCCYTMDFVAVMMIIKDGKLL